MGAERLRMIDLSYIFKDMTTKDNRTIKTTNPYSGESAMLNKEEFALYHIIKGAELAEDYDTVRKGLHKFGKMNASAYMTLLD